MNLKILIAVAVSAAFAGGALADDKKASSGGSKASGASGAEQMFKSLDKDKDGYLSKEEVTGSPHAKDFDQLDKNADGKLSRQEHAAAPEHQGEKSGAGGTKKR